MAVVVKPVTLLPQVPLGCRIVLEYSVFVASCRSSGTSLAQPCPTAHVRSGSGSVVSMQWRRGCEGPARPRSGLEAGRGARTGGETTSNCGESVRAKQNLAFAAWFAVGLAEASMTTPEQRRKMSFCKTRDMMVDFDVRHGALT